MQTYNLVHYIYVQYKLNPYLEITYLVMIINHFTITYIFYVKQLNGNQHLLKFEKKIQKKKNNVKKLKKKLKNKLKIKFIKNKK